MNRKTRNTAASIGGVLAVGALLTGAGLAYAQTDDNNEQPTTTGAPVPETDDQPDRPWGDGTPPWGDGEAPWGDGEAPWGDGEGPFADGQSPFGEGGLPGCWMGQGRFGGGIEEIAADLGLTVEELEAAFESGQTLPEIAEANGVDLADIFGDSPFGDGEHPWGDGESPFADGEFPWGDGPPPWVQDSEG